MIKNKRIPLKIGDTVKIISGSEKNKTGEIIRLYPKNGKLLIKGINFKFKHMKPSKDNEIGDIKQIEAPIHHSNVKLISKLS